MRCCVAPTCSRAPGLIAEKVPCAAMSAGLGRCGCSPAAPSYGLRIRRPAELARYGGVFQVISDRRAASRSVSPVETAGNVASTPTRASHVAGVRHPNRRRARRARSRRLRHANSPRSGPSRYSGCPEPRRRHPQPGPPHTQPARAAYRWRRSVRDHATFHWSFAWLGIRYAGPAALLTLNALSRWTTRCCRSMRRRSAITSSRRSRTTCSNCARSKASRRPEPARSPSPSPKEAVGVSASRDSADDRAGAGRGDRVGDT